MAYAVFRHPTAPRTGTPAWPREPHHRCVDATRTGRVWNLVIAMIADEGRLLGEEAYVIT